jgi:prepilin peptidase CpaA
MEFLRPYFSIWTNSELPMTAVGVLVIDIVLLAAIVYCAYTDTTSGKIYNKITFPAMLAGLLLNGAFAGGKGFIWALIGLIVGMGIQWVPFLLHLAKAGDVKLLMLVGALKGWAFCLFGFLYGAAAFGFILVPWLYKRGELGAVSNTIKGYFATAAITQSAPDAPAPAVTRRYVPWGLGLVIGFIIALILERLTGRPVWIR